VETQVQIPLGLPAITSQVANVGQTFAVLDPPVLTRLDPKSPRNLTNREAQTLTVVLHHPWIGGEHTGTTAWLITR
jgi:GrpB-like predicted nucleotidyltransferase (UPF0157 family)